VAQRNSSQTLLKSVLSHTTLMALSVVFLIPFVWLLTSSFKSELHLFTQPPEWIPRGEYLQLEDDTWAEVVLQEVVEWHKQKYDENGLPLERRPKRTKVRLGDGLGDPLMADLFTAPPPVDLNDMDRGVFHDALTKAFADSGNALPDNPRMDPISYGKRWEIPIRKELTYIIKYRDGKLHVYSDAPAWRVVASVKIETKPWPTGRHYVKGVHGFNFPLFLQNTLVIALFTVLGTVFSCSWVAFGFSILQWRGRDKIFYLMLATMMLPPQVTMIPLFVIFKQLGWINTYMPLIFPSFLGNAFFIFLLRQFFLTIPQDLIDAARVDGCSTFRIYWQIALPLSIPALATVALFTFMFSWNDFMGPLIYVVDEAKYTLSLGLAMFKGRFASRYGEMMAVSVLLTIPIVVLFFFTQKTFIQGIKTSGMKG